MNITLKSEEGGKLTLTDKPSAILKLSGGLSGAAGPANSLSIGTVTTTALGSAASASITGASPNQKLNLTLPRGTDGVAGPANTLSVGTVSTGVTPQVVITGAAPSQVLNMVLPAGPTGQQGPQGPAGPAGQTGQQGPAGAGVLIDPNGVSWALSVDTAGALITTMITPGNNYGTAYGVAVYA